MNINIDDEQNNNLKKNVNIIKSISKKELPAIRNKITKIEKECCSKDDNQNGDCDCCCADCICERTCCVDFYCRCGNNTGSTSGLCYLVPIALLIGLFYLNKPCGKNVSRLVSITALTICEIVFLIMSFIAACQTKFEIFIIINIIISLSF